MLLGTFIGMMEVRAEDDATRRRDRTAAVALWMARQELIETLPDEPTPDDWQRLYNLIDALDVRAIEAKFDMMRQTLA